MALRTSPILRSPLRRPALFFAVVLVLFAWVSVNPFHPDEHFQILEFASFKLGQTPAELLPWEHRAEMRSWLMPWVAFVIGRALRALGSSDPFVWATCLRFVAAAFGAIATHEFLVHAEHSAPEGTQSEQAARWVLLTGFVAYIFARFSSESLTTSLFVLGFTALERECKTGAPRPVPLLFGGGLFGLAFHCRYQTGLMVASYALWRLLFARPTARELAFASAGLALGLALGVAADSWGYGHLALPFVHYVKANVIDGIAAAFSTEPWFAYLYLPIANLFAPVAGLTLALAIVFWIRFPRHVYTWLVAPSFVGFSLLGHKEERFLFPVALIAAWCTFPGLCTRKLSAASAPMPAPTTNALLEKVGYVAATASTLLLVMQPINWREHLAVSRFCYRALNAEDVLIVHSDDLPQYPLYRGTHRTQTYTADCGIAEGSYILTRAGAPPDHITATLAFTEWTLPDVLRTTLERSYNPLQARLGGPLLPFTVLSVFRVTQARVGTPCAARPYRPIALDPPKLQKR